MMNKQDYRTRTDPSLTNKNYRTQLLDRLPVREQRLNLAGISTAVLEGGDGPPIVLLHGPGESGMWWMRVISDLVTTHRVIVPDLPGHGASGMSETQLNADRVYTWLNELIENTCTNPPALVGHALGGAIAARFAVNHNDRIKLLVLVDSLGLSRFRPAPAFAFKLILYMMRPNEKTYKRFLPECIHNVDNLRKQMGKYWEPFLAYNLERTRAPGAKSALRQLMSQVGVPKIPAKDLEQISVPTFLIWGRYDRANQLNIAKDASKRFRWQLHVIEESGDDPKLEQPEAFLRALYTSLGTTIIDPNENNNNRIKRENKQRATN